MPRPSNGVEMSSAFWLVYLGPASHLIGPSLEVRALASTLPSYFLLEDVQQSPPSSTIYWLKFLAKPSLLYSRPIGLAISQEFVFGCWFILVPPINSTMGFDRRSLLWDHASVVSASHTSKFRPFRPSFLASPDQLFLLAKGPIGR